MALSTKTATALVAALRLVRTHGSAPAALRAAGIDLSKLERFEGLDVEPDEAPALGFLAGRVSCDARVRKADDPTAFVMDPELVVQGAEGESIMRLPWFEDDLFVGRQVPDISEMPINIRRLCTVSYTAALAGERGRFSFTSYGHRYTVEAMPVRSENGQAIEAVLAVATPSLVSPSATAAYERVAVRLQDSAARAEERANLHRLAGRINSETAERDAAARARAGAERALANAAALRSRAGGAENAKPPTLTSREIEVLIFASHGLTYTEIADQLAVSGATVRTHFQNIFIRLGASDKAAAVAMALRHGLID